MRADGLPSNADVTTRLSNARDAHQKIMPGKPALTVPVGALHFFTAGDGSLEFVIDMDQVIYLADELLRREPGGE